VASIDCMTSSATRFVSAEVSRSSQGSVEPASFGSDAAAETPDEREPAEVILNDLNHVKYKKKEQL